MVKKKKAYPALAALSNMVFAYAFPQCVEQNNWPI